ncbi:MAG: hypothetical protein WD690_15390 [Vicinamibacterales bacterium]
MPMHFTRTFAAALVLAFLPASSGCQRQNATNPSAPIAAPAVDPGAPERLASVLRGSFDEQNIDAAIEALARAGVRVYTDDEARLIQHVAGTPSPLKFFRQQVRNMALSAATGEGSSARDLNVFVPAIVLNGRELPISAVLAAYTAQANTFGAELSRKLTPGMTIEQHEAGSWPTLVLSLFLADTVPAGAPRSAFALMPVVYADDGPCGVANDFLNSAGKNAVELIVGPATGGSSDLLFAVIAGAADAVFGMAVNVAREAASEALGLATVQKAMFAINLITTAQATFEQWTVNIVPEPAPIAFINHGSQTEGRFKATVIGGEGIAWPEAIQACAKLLGMSLPGSPLAPGSKAKWMTLDGFGTYVAETGREDVIKPDNTATLRYRAIKSEDVSRHAGGGPTRREPFSAIMIVENATKEAVKNFLKQVNKAIGGIVPDGAKTEVFRRLVEPWGGGFGEIEYHDLRAATASFSRQAVSLRAYTCSAPGGPWNYTVKHAFAGTATGTFSAPGSYRWAMSGGFAAISASGSVALQGNSLVFSGGSVAKSPAGAGASADGFNVPIVYGDVAECPAR